MFKITLAATLIALCGLAVSQTKEVQTNKGSAPVDKHTQSAISDHQKMAKAHGEAAQCLASGKSEKVCHEALKTACPDVGIGKYCGMKHKH